MDTAASIEREVIGDTVQAIIRHQIDEVSARTYREVVEWVWKDEELSERDAQRLANLADQLKVDTSSAAAIEREVMGETKENVLQSKLQRMQEEKHLQQTRQNADQLYGQGPIDVAADQGQEVAGQVQDMASQMAESLPEGYEALGQPFTDEQGNRVLQAQDDEDNTVIVRRGTDDEGNTIDSVFDAQGNLLDERIVIHEPITGGEEDTGQDEMEDQAEEHVQQAAGLHQQPNATEAAKQKAQELGVDLNQVQGTGAEGRITVRDIIDSEQPGSSGANQFRRTAPKPDQQRTWWQFWFE